MLSCHTQLGQTWSLVRSMMAHFFLGRGIRSCLAWYPVQQALKIIDEDSKVSSHLIYNIWLTFEWLVKALRHCVPLCIENTSHSRPIGGPPSCFVNHVGEMFKAESCYWTSMAELILLVEELCNCPKYLVHKVPHTAIIISKYCGNCAAYTCGSLRVFSTLLESIPRINVGCRNGACSLPRRWILLERQKRKGWGMRV